MVENYLATPASGTTLYLKYHPGKKILEIGFRTREVYQYLKFPLQAWELYYKTVQEGNSSGKFFNEHIKEKYKFKKIT